MCRAIIGFSGGKVKRITKSGNHLLLNPYETDNIILINNGIVNDMSCYEVTLFTDSKI